MFRGAITLLATLVVLLHNGVAAQQQDDTIGVQGTGGHSCTLTYQGETFPCALGKNGVTSNKVEGDDCTPAGSFPLRRVFYRADRVPDPNTALLTNITQSNYGWCDDPSAPEYNTFVTLPFEPSHEELWLNGSYYDLMSVIGYNDAPPVPGLGSAIFFHVTPDYGSTSGCVALALSDLQWVLARISTTTVMNITA